MRPLTALYYWPLAIAALIALFFLLSQHLSSLNVFTSNNTSHFFRSPKSKDQY